MLIHFIIFCSLKELINAKYNLSIETATESADKTQNLLEQLLQTSDALDEKLTRIEENLNTQIRDIKKNLESPKLQNKHEIDNIKNTLNDVEKGQDFSKKFEEQNIKIIKLIQDIKKLSMENSKLSSEVNNLIDQQESQKVETTQLGQYIRS